MMAGPKFANELIFRRLGTVAESTGGHLFYSKLAEFFANVLRCKRWLVMRYSRYGAPEFIVNSAMPEKAVESYLRGLYRLDPLLRLVQSGTRRGWFILSRLSHSKFSDTYFDRLFQTSMIYDEAAILLSAPGGSSIAICVERAARKFSHHDIEHVKALYPVIESLHHVHLDRIFTLPSRGGRRKSQDRAQQAVMILDNRCHVVFRNARWKLLERKGQTPDVRSIAEARGTGMRALGTDFVFHWEDLPDTFAVAPGGRFCIIEPRGLGYVRMNIQKALSQFQHRYNLTPRERDIVDLVLQGYPNSKIAVKLGIATGTVRNHRYRLYYKLDITTERELFYTFIDLLLGRNGATANKVE